MTTPLDMAVYLASSGDPEHRAYAVAMLARSLSDEDPADPLRAPWSVDVALPAAAKYLHLAPQPELLERARALMPTISDATLNYTSRSLA